MIGSNLGLDLPLTSDTLSTIVSKTATALSAIEVSIADLATQAAINITGDFSIAGNKLTNVAGVTLVTGNAPTAVGSIYYASNEFYAVDATGIIQLTSAGQLNIVAARGFTGDYGQPGVTAEAKFDNATGQYRMYKSTGVYGDVAAANVVLEGSTSGTVKLHPPATVTSYTVTFPSALPGAASVVQLDASGNLTASNALTGDVSTTGKVTATDHRYTSSQIIGVPLSGAIGNPNGIVLPGGGNIAWTYGASYDGIGNSIIGIDMGNTSNAISVPVVGLRQGDVITGYTSYWSKLSANTTTLHIRLVRYRSAIGSETVIDSSSNSGNSPGLITITSPALSEGPGYGYQYYFVITRAAAVLVDTIYGIEIFVNRP